MEIISWNVNGIRAAVKKGFLEWFQKTKPNILCLQEVRAEQDQIPVNLVRPHGYYAYFNAAHKKGYSGVAVYTKEKPMKVEYKLEMERFDQEGRMISLEYQNFTLINLYLPNGGRNKENLDYKLKVYQHLLGYLKENKNKSIILTGDFNIAHQEIDLARPKQNYNNTMFTPKEREQIDKIININLVDTFRVFNKKGGNYTWWSNFANARNRNLGWRIDYVFISQKLTSNIKKAFILPEVKGSDHCPIGIEI
jgi:exodeoxyribonuclease-3